MGLGGCPLGAFLLCRVLAVCDVPCLCPASWMEACLGEELPPSTELEETLRNGVLLAKLGHCFAPAVVPVKKIYDPEQTRYKVWLWQQREGVVPLRVHPQTLPLLLRAE